MHLESADMSGGVGLIFTTVVFLGLVIDYSYFNGIVQIGEIGDSCHILLQGIFLSVSLFMWGKLSQ